MYKIISLNSISLNLFFFYEIWEIVVSFVEMHGTFDDKQLFLGMPSLAEVCPNQDMKI